MLKHSRTMVGGDTTNLGFLIQMPLNPTNLHKKCKKKK